MSSDPLATLLDALPLAAVLFRADGTIVAVNRLGRALFVVDPVAPLESQHWRVVLHGLGDQLSPAMTDVAQGETVVVDAVSFETDRLMDVRLVPYVDGGVLVTATGVPGGDLSHLPVDLLEQALDLGFDLSPSALRLVDLHGRILRMNAVARRDHAEPVADTLRALWERDAPHDVAESRPLPFLESPGMRALAGMRVDGHLLDVRRHHGIQSVLAFAVPMRAEDGRVRGALMIDRDAEADRQVKQRQEAIALEQSRALLSKNEAHARERRLAAVGQLAAGVMHDVNNALNPIMAAAYLLQLHAEDPVAVRDYAARIQKAAETGAATASRVGRFIRQEPLHPGVESELDLSVLAAEVLDLTEPMRAQRASDGHDVIVERILSQPVGARGIPGEIREAILNLVQNALDAMPTGGRLTLRSAIEGPDACLSVRDTGVGMTAEVRERAFEPFFTTKGSRGSGLGLAEVYGIARRHRGTVTITSLPSRGTEVTLRLPAADAAAPVEPDRSVDASAAQSILVVEDHEDGREFLRRMLADMGHRVEAVATCAEARACLRQGLLRAAPYDLLLTDVGLPDGNGWELVQEAHRDHAARRIGVLTGWEALPGTHDTSAASFILRKPLRAAELQAQIAGNHPSPHSEPAA